MEKTRIVNYRNVADFLVWLGFEYTKNEEGKYIFKRDSKFDGAWKDLHYLRAKYNKRANINKK